MSRKKKSRTRPRSLGKKLTPKQAAFLRHYTNPKSDAFSNATRACERAGYKGDTGSNQLAVQGVRNVRNPNLREAVSSALHKLGFTPEFAAKLLMGAMRAQKVQLLPNGKGRLVPRTSPDHRTQMVGLDKALRLLGTTPEAAAVQGRVPPCELRELPENQKPETEPVSERSSADRLLMRSASEKIKAALRLIAQDESLSAAELRALLLHLAQQEQVTLNGDSTNNP